MGGEGAADSAAGSGAASAVARGDADESAGVAGGDAADAGPGGCNPCAGARSSGIPGAAEIPGCGIGSAPSSSACARLPPRSLVYLSADAPRVLWRLERGVADVVGGLVDRNRHKGACAAKAAALGLPTARLPLEAAGPAGPGAAGSRRARVLTTNKVVEVLAAVAATGGGACAEADAGAPPSAELAAAWARALRDALGTGTHDCDDAATALVTPVVH